MRSPADSFCDGGVRFSLLIKQCWIPSRWSATQGERAASDQNDEQEHSVKYQLEECHLKQFLSQNLIFVFFLSLMTFKT